MNKIFRRVSVWLYEKMDKSFCIEISPEAEIMELKFVSLLILGILIMFCAMGVVVVVFIFIWKNVYGGVSLFQKEKNTHESEESAFDEN
ncbi:MAG: hypothetical protein UR65_C0020G0001 [Candidatus Moranbacteria bacterium GW2011_GWE2_35_164]|nr:MAG: hypothetical protein UR65_C0020G0001 [Candidatus Moranbacteria bacterium GW2011_GWE2_35_164]